MAGCQWWAIFAEMAEPLRSRRKRDLNFVPTDLSSQYMTFIERCDIGGMITKNWLFLDCFAKMAEFLSSRKKGVVNFVPKDFSS